MPILPYLHFNGNCEEAFKFYAHCLDGKIETLTTYAGTPAEQQVPPEWRGKVIHARLNSAAGILLASDTVPGRYKEPAGFRANLQVTDPAEAERIFAALSDGATIVMPLQQTFWAVRFGMLDDKFGIPWMINCE